LIVALPTSDERTAILRRHAERFPAAFNFTLPIDGGKDDQLRILLGTPAEGSDGWETAVAATFKPRLVEADSGALVTDCLLWPDASTWGGIVRRWPALPETVARAVRAHLGASLAALVEPTADEVEPPAVAAALERNAGAVWRQLKPAPDVCIDVAIQPPEEVVWRAFQEQIKRDDAKHWRLALDMATASVTASTLPVGDVFKRWPGCAMLVTLMASKLAGIAAEFERGEF
jgi:hypothetical protein